MSADEPTYRKLDPAQLADWLRRQGDQCWWTVDGDIRYMERVGFPCPSDVLAEATTAIAQPLMVHVPPAAAGQKAGEVWSRDLDTFVEEADGDRVLRLRWADQDAESEWILAEDRESAERAARSALAKE
jgi:hypothetical protein